MSGSYREIMEKIQVTDDMKERILQSVGENVGQNKQINRHYVTWKQLACIAACLALIVTGGLFIPAVLKMGGNHTDVIVGNIDNNTGYIDSTEATASSTYDGNNTMAYPGVFNISEFSSTELLSEKMGFIVPELNEMPFPVNEKKYYSYWGELAQVEYIGSGNRALFRMSRGNEDNSGDYNFYSAVKEVKQEGYTITLKGDKDQYLLATWQRENYSYSLAFDDGLAEGEILAVIEGTTFH
ncbi:MAG: hypothetical protein ACI4D0_07625 [Lachnospira sp.]